jgi:hypothetical protein
LGDCAQIFAQLRIAALMLAEAAPVVTEMHIGVARKSASIVRHAPMRSRATPQISG